MTCHHHCHCMVSKSVFRSKPHMEWSTYFRSSDSLTDSYSATLSFAMPVSLTDKQADECGWLWHTNNWDVFQKHELHIFVHRMWDCKAEMHICFSLELEYLASLFQAKMVCTKTVQFFSFFIMQYKNSKRTVETWAASGSYCLHTLASIVTQHHCPLNSWHQTSCCSTYLYFQPSAI